VRIGESQLPFSIFLTQAILQVGAKMAGFWLPSYSTARKANVRHKKKRSDWNLAPGIISPSQDITV
jgi:hypothetical protein